MTDSGRPRLLVAALSLVVASGSIGVACRDAVPRPTLPTLVTPEVTRHAPRPPPIDPKKAREERQRQKRREARKVGVVGSGAGTLVLAAAVGWPKTRPVDAEINDVIELPPPPDGDVAIVLDAGH